MHFVMSAHPVISLIAGILILLVPRLLSYIVAVYLIITASSDWSADWLTDLLWPEKYHFSGKGNEGMSLAVCD